jgi:hypothetical protein
VRLSRDLMTGLAAFALTALLIAAQAAHPFA